MELVSIAKLETLINAELDKVALTHGLRITVEKTSVVFEDGNNWMSYIEPKPDCMGSYQPSPEAKKMIQKLMGDMRLKYNLE
jgi:hypothetical protein